MTPPLAAIRVRSGPGALSRLVRGLREPLAAHVREAGGLPLILLAIEEAAVNTLEHGYRGEVGKPLFVAACAAPPRRTRVILRDRAPMVDVTRLPAGDLGALARARESRGRGLALIRLLASGIEHRARRGGGNELVLLFEDSHLDRVLRDRILHAA
jgi:anti-sigma regulatory factor (Ser/Thr protein kinase)